MEEKVVCDDHDSDLPSTSQNEVTKSMEQLNLEQMMKEEKLPHISTQEHDGLPQEWRTHRDHPIDNIIGDINKGVTKAFQKEKSIPLFLSKDLMIILCLCKFMLTISFLVPQMNLYVVNLQT